MREFKVVRQVYENYYVSAENEEGAIEQIESGIHKPGYYGNVRIVNVEEVFDYKKCDECHQNKQETVDLDLPDGTHAVVCKECVLAIVEQFQAEESE